MTDRCFAAVASEAVAAAETIVAVLAQVTARLNVLFARKRLDNLQTPRIPNP